MALPLHDPRPKSRLARFLVGASARINYEWALRRPGQPPFIVLTEFPRSGGNWVRDMLGDALQLPVPRFGRFPVTFRSIIHSHDHRPSRHPTVYVVRDPRDVFQSHFYKTLATWQNGAESLRRRIQQLHPSLAQVRDSRAVEGSVWIRFYEEWRNRPLGSRVPWDAHVIAFLDHPPPNVAVIRYEDVQHSPMDTLSAAIAQLTGSQPDEDAVAFAVRRNEFSRQTGRAKGQVDNSATKRKGVAGAWRADMEEEIKLRFLRDMRGALRLAGYDEEDDESPAWRVRSGSAG